jgi:acyl-CoA thioesterase I
MKKVLFLPMPPSRLPGLLALRRSITRATIPLAIAIGRVIAIAIGISMCIAMGVVAGPGAALAAQEGTTSDAELPGNGGGESPAAAPPASSDPAGATPPGGEESLATRCEAPEEIAPEQERVDEIAANFAKGHRPLIVVVLGSLSRHDTDKQGPTPFAPRLQEILQAELAARGIDLPVQVKLLGRARAMAADLAGVINREVLPLKPALVIWLAGRADARQGHPPNRFAQSLKEGLARLRDAGIPAILGDIQFHPQFEALFRTDEYRNYVRWMAGKFNLPLLRRYEMIEHWTESDRIDLDSGNDADQQAAYGFIQECLAYQAARMILAAAGPVPGKRE